MSVSFADFMNRSSTPDKRAEPDKAQGIIWKDGSPPPSSEKVKTRETKPTLHLPSASSSLLWKDDEDMTPTPKSLPDVEEVEELEELEVTVAPENIISESQFSSQLFPSSDKQPSPLCAPNLVANISYSLPPAPTTSTSTKSVELTSSIMSASLLASSSSSSSSPHSLPHSPPHSAPFAAPLSTTSHSSSSTSSTSSSSTLRIDRTAGVVDQQATIIQALTEALHGERAKRYAAQEKLKRTESELSITSKTNEELRDAVQQFSKTMKDVLDKQAKQSKVIIDLRAERRDLLTAIRRGESGQHHLSVLCTSSGSGSGGDSSSGDSSSGDSSSGDSSSGDGRSQKQSVQSDEKLHDLHRKVELQAERNRAADVVSSISHVADVLRSVKNAAERKAERAEARVESAVDVSKEHERITRNVTNARVKDLAELSLLRSNKRRVEGEFARERLDADRLRRKIVALEIDYTTQTKACETLIEEMQAQQNLMDVMETTSRDRQEELFATKQQLALVRHQNTELSGVVAKLTLELRFLRDERENAGANIHAMRDTARHLTRKTTDVIVSFRKVKEYLPPMLRRERVKHRTMRTLVRAQLAEFDSWMTHARNDLDQVIAGMLRRGGGREGRGGRGDILMESKERDQREETRQEDDREASMAMNLLKAAQVKMAHESAMRFAMPSMFAEEYERNKNEEENAINEERKRRTKEKVRGDEMMVVRQGGRDKRRQSVRSRNGAAAKMPPPPSPMKKPDVPRQQTRTKKAAAFTPAKTPPTKNQHQQRTAVGGASVTPTRNRTENQQSSSSYAHRSQRNAPFSILPEKKEMKEAAIRAAMDPLELMRMDIVQCYRSSAWFGAIHRCFEARDRTRSGTVPYHEFRGIIRRDLCIPVDSIGDSDIRRLFSMFQDGNNNERLLSKAFCSWMVSK